jgi:hypothetical protein
MRIGGVIPSDKQNHSNPELARNVSQPYAFSVRTFTPRLHGDVRCEANFPVACLAERRREAISDSPS